MRLVTILSILLFLINGCTQVEPEVEYVIEDVPKTENLGSVKVFRAKYYPLDKNNFRVSKHDAYKSSEVARELRAKSRYYERDIKSYVRAYFRKELNEM